MKNCAAVRVSEAIGTKDVTQGPSKAKPNSELPEVREVGLTSKETCTSSSGKEASDLVDTLVLTLEGGVAERQPLAERAQGMSIEEDARKGEQEKVGSALADPKIANAEEQRAQRARNLPRKNAKSGQSSWTVPTPKPRFDADSFEDPVCDEFWKDIWVACAAHNVGVCDFPSYHHWQLADST